MKKGNWSKSQDAFNDLKVPWRENSANCGLSHSSRKCWRWRTTRSESLQVHKLHRLLPSYLKYRLVLETLFLKSVPAFKTKEWVLHRYFRKHHERLKLELVKLGLGTFLNSSLVNFLTFSCVFLFQMKFPSKLRMNRYPCYSSVASPVKVKTVYCVNVPPHSFVLVFTVFLVTFLHFNCKI